MKLMAMAGAALLAVCSAVHVLEASGIVATYNSTTQKVTMVDTVNGAVIISPTNAVKVYDTSWDFHTGETPLTPTSITFTPQTDGYDIEVLLVNNTTTSQRVGTLWVSGITFDTTSYYRNFDYFAHGDGEASATQNIYGNWFPGGPTYPGGSYSPVDVVRGTVYVPPPIIEGPGGGGSFTGGSTQGSSGKGEGSETTPIEEEPVEPARAEYALGVSLLYPVLDYDVSVQKEYQCVGGTWQVGFYINPKYNASGGTADEYNSAGNIPPYDSAHPNANRRTYKVCVRVLRNPSSYPVLPAEWLRTLEPYREYFQKTYGGTRYTPDYRPVEGITMAVLGAANSSNPYGFSTERPDVNGWGPIVSDLASQRSDGWPRQMLWAPSGCNSVATDPSTNFRYEFTSQWQNISAMSSSQDQLTGYAFNNFGNGGVGLWWGHSAETMSGWSSSTITPMDQTSATLRGRAFTELDGARAVGAREIGLDQYIMRRRSGFAWLQEMRMRYPEMRFCGEAVQPDIIHLQSANFELVGFNPQATDHSTCSPALPRIRPLALADFLLQKHETWGYSWVNWVNDNDCNGGGWNLNTYIMGYWPQYMASQGYVPVLSLSPGSVRSVNTSAATGGPSYTLTVPSDLRTPYCPQVTAQPVTTLAGTCYTDVTLHATAVSPRSLTLSYQWYFRPESLDPANDGLPADLVNGMMAPCNDASHWANETTDTLTIHLGPKTFGTYSLLVTEPGGGPTWTAFTRVYSAGDIDRNGVIDTDDYNLFATLFTGTYADPRADVNHDGVIDYYDYLDFIDAYSTGC